MLTPYSPSWLAVPWWTLLEDSDEADAIVSRHDAVGVAMMYTWLRQQGVRDLDEARRRWWGRQRLYRLRPELWDTLACDIGPLSPQRRSQCLYLMQDQYTETIADLILGSAELPLPLLTVGPVLALYPDQCPRLYDELGDDLLCFLRRVEEQTVSRVLQRLLTAPGCN